MALIAYSTITSKFKALLIKLTFYEQTSQMTDNLQGKLNV